MKNTYIKLLIGLVLFATWLCLVVFKVQGSEDLINMIKLALAGLGVYHLGDRPTTGAAPSKEAGFASLTMLVALTIVALALSGCASVQQAVQAYGSLAVTGARATSDTIIEAQKVSLCGLPLSAIARHPEIVPAVRSLCLAPGDKTSAELLDAAQAVQTAPKS